MPGTAVADRKSRSRSWHSGHVRDSYVRSAKRNGYRSRSAYKLIEIDDRFHVLRKGMRVLDLGAAPGGWSQVAADRVGPSGSVVALDRLKMEPVPETVFVQTDFFVEDVAERLYELSGNRRFDLVISDMAPNVTGIRDADDGNFAKLADRIDRIHGTLLKGNGSSLCKMFQGEALERALELQRSRFRKVAVAHLKATKKASREVYLIAEGHVADMEKTEKRRN